MRRIRDNGIIADEISAEAKGLHDVLVDVGKWSTVERVAEENHGLHSGRHGGRNHANSVVNELCSLTVETVS